MQSKSDPVRVRLRVRRDHVFCRQEKQMLSLAYDKLVPIIRVGPVGLASVEGVAERLQEIHAGFPAEVNRVPVERVAELPARPVVLA